MGSRKRQDSLSELGIWGPLEKIEGEGRGREASRENGELKKIRKIKICFDSKNPKSIFHWEKLKADIWDLFGGYGVGIRENVVIGCK